ncbi:MAG: 4-alpha-glucanotransferase, partial [Bifidobacteriaceae bacterium]|nr:4-alpha-glucanotransferase [Bifidobacteriaceae bacterium]
MKKLLNNPFYISKEDRESTPLVELAHKYGVATCYYLNKKVVHISDETLFEILNVLGADLDNSSEDTLVKTIERCNKNKDSSNIKKVVNISNAHKQSDNIVIDLLDSTRLNGLDLIDIIKITLESGEQIVPKNIQLNDDTLELAFENELPIGYHKLVFSLPKHINQQFFSPVTFAKDKKEEEEIITNLIISPKSLPVPTKYITGIMSQMYSMRSHDSWGIGDFIDLKNFSHKCFYDQDLGFVLINPVHAGEPVAPITPSPYLPTSRRFINHIYIRPENAFGYDKLNDELKTEITNIKNTIIDENNN